MGENYPSKQPEEGIVSSRDSAPVRLRTVQPRKQAENLSSDENETVIVTRRSDKKRRDAEARSSAKAADETIRRAFLVPRYWHLEGVCATLSLPIAVALVGSLPPTSVSVAAALTLLIAFLGRIVSIRDRLCQKSSLALKVGGWIAIVAPAILHGYAMAVWATETDLGWVWALVGMIAVTAGFGSMLHERPLQQFVVLFGAWGAVAVTVGTPVVLSGFALGCVLVAMATRYHSTVHRKRTEISQATERKRNRAEDILRDYEETGQGWFWESDRRGLISYLSPSVFEVLQRPEEEILGRPFLELFDLGDENCEGERTLNFHMSARSSFMELGSRAATPGEERWWSISGRPAYDIYGNFVGFRGSGTDLTEKKRSQENVNRLAQYDSLTGLANRFQMQELLEKILNAPQEQHRECSVFLLDLDRFKQVNDTLGHPAGDALLKQVAKRIERAVGKDGRVGRLGGDEFEVIIPGRTSRDGLAQLAQVIIHSLSQPYSIDGQRVVIGASIGIAVSPSDGVTSESIIRNSDLALYAAKDGGRGRSHFYSNDLHAAAEERSQLEQDLRDAIANGELELYYQPVIYADDDKIAGFEALLRWNHPVRGWLSPTRFVPVAEDAGLISTIGDWAIRTACNELSRWPNDIRCAVNVSPLQFANPQLPSIVTNAIARAGIDPSRLELEITESVFLNDDEGTEAMFTALKRIGVRLALDDFGTGYSSLGYLKKAPFDKIKIDQSFVRGATEPGNRNGAIITSITSLAKALGMDTTAEGVETLDELELIRSLGCSHVQGYIYSKAITADAAFELLQEGPSMTAKGPRSARAPRQTMLRKVMLEHGGEFYKGRIRNMSGGGAMIEGLWNVPPGTAFNIAVTESLVVGVISIWSDHDRMGVKFDRPVDLEKTGLLGTQEASPRPDGIRKTA